MVDLVWFSFQAFQENPLDLLQDQLFGGGQDLLWRRGSTGVVGKLQKIQKNRKLYRKFMELYIKIVEFP